MSTVTAIVPAYERPGHIVTAIERVLKQTYPNVHVLVGDDSTSDVVERVVARFDPERVTYHRNRPALAS